MPGPFQYLTSMAGEIRAFALLALGAFLLALATFQTTTAIHINAKQATDFTTFYESALLARTGQDPYLIAPNRWPYLYPPTLLWLFGPLTYLSTSNAVAVWTLLIFCMWMGAATIVHRLVRVPIGPAFLTWAIPSLITYRFILRCSNFGQVDLLVFLIVLLALVGLKTGRPRLGAATLAAATVIKVLPIIPAAVVLARRGVATWITYASTLVMLLLLPVCTWGVTRHAELLSSWLGGQMLAHASNFSGANDPSNQSLSAAVARLLIVSDPVRVRECVERGYIAPEATVSRPLWASLALLLVSVTIVTVLTHRRKSALGLEGSAGLLLMHLLSRKTWETHLVTLILVHGSLISTAVTDRRIATPITVAVTLAAVLENFYAPVILGSRMSDLAQFYSPTTWSLIILWIAVIGALRTPDHEAPSSETAR